MALTKKQRSTRSAKGWATRRMKRLAQLANEPVPGLATIAAAAIDGAVGGINRREPPLCQQSKHLAESDQKPSAGDPPPTGISAHAGKDGWNQSVPKNPVATINETIDGAVKLAAIDMEAAAALLHAMVRTECSNATDVAWAEHRKIVQRMRTADRDNVITDLMATAAIHLNTSGKVFTLGRHQVVALIEALVEAGYSADGNRPARR